MRKLNIVAIVLAVVLLLANVAQFFYWKNLSESTVEQYATDIAELQLQLNSFGNRTTVYTVSTAVKAGDAVVMDELIPLDTYETLVTSQYVMDPLDLEGRFFKIAVNPGTPLTTNMFMDEELDDTMRDHDIMLDSMPVDTQVGDYIDIRMTLPYGDDYIVMSHKRIYAINEETIKIRMNEYEWNVYLGALVDYYLNREYGCTLYASRYIEPGLQQEAVEFYAVPTNIATLLTKNPNIIDKKGASSLNVWREQLEEILVIFRTEDDTVDSDAGTLASGRQEFNEAVESDRDAMAEQRAEEAEEAAEAAAAEQEIIGDDFWDEDVTTDTTTGG